MSSNDEHAAIADRWYKSIENGDIEGVRSIYSADVRIWYSTGGVEQTADQNPATVGRVAANNKSLRYASVRREPTRDEFVQQHVLRGRLKSGREFTLPASSVVKIEKGMVVRLDEYRDSAKAAELRE